MTDRPRISGAEIRRLREERGWSQSELARVLNTALGKNYKGGTIGQWERERPGHLIGPAPSAFLYELAAEPPPPLEDEPPAPPEPGRVADDVPPRWDAAPPQPALPPGPAPTGMHAKACAELWEIIATGVGMVGAATGSEALVADGRIIARDKDKLGEAWGKLAETNDTFRKMLASMTEGGAWLQVAVVTGSTVSKCYQSHNEIARKQRAFAPPQPEPEDDESQLRAIS